MEKGDFFVGTVSQLHYPTRCQGDVGESRSYLNPWNAESQRGGAVGICFCHTDRKRQKLVVHFVSVGQDC